MQQQEDMTPILLGLGLAGFLYIQSQQPAAATQNKAAGIQAPLVSGGSGIGGALAGAAQTAIGGLGLGVANLAANAGAAIGQAVGQSFAGLSDKHSDIRGALRQLGDTELRAYLGIKPSDTGRIRAQQSAWVSGLFSNMEAFAARAYSYLSRPDVASWTLDGEGTFTINYKGIAQPYVFGPPGIVYEDASSPGGGRNAWSAEPIVRTLGQFFQSGGRIVAPFIAHPYPYGFSDGNPFARPDDLLSRRQQFTGTGGTDTTGKAGQQQNTSAQAGQGS